MVFVITGHQRSGTTLVAKLFNAHPEIRVTGEFGNFLCLGQTYPRYRRRLIKRWGGIALRDWPLSVSFAGKGAHRTVIWENNRFVYRYLRAVRSRRAPAISGKTIESVLRELFPGAKAVGDKYPEYILGLDDLASDNALSPLAIYRDCRDVTSSTLRKARTEWRKMPVFVRRVNTAEKVACRWVRAIEAMERNSEKVYRVKYEDLVQESETVLGDLSRWVEVDPAGFEITRISSRSIGNYRNGLTKDELTTVMEIAGPTMERLGYL